jgi:hypothetical protein
MRRKKLKTVSSLISHWLNLFLAGDDWKVDRNKKLSNEDNEEVKFNHEYKEERLEEPGAIKLIIDPSFEFGRSEPYQVRTLPPAKKERLTCARSPCPDEPKYIIHEELICQGHKLQMKTRGVEIIEVEEKINEVDRQVWLIVHIFFSFRLLSTSTYSYCERTNILFQMGQEMS